MYRLIRRIVVAFSLVFTFLPHVAAGKYQERLTGKRGKCKIKLENATVREAFNIFASACRVPVGLILEKFEEPYTPTHISLEIRSDTPADEVLELLLRKAEVYKLIKIGEVYNVLPKEALSPFSQRLLREKLDKFVIEKKTPRFSIRQGLADSPRVANLAKLQSKKAIITQFGCGFQSCYIGNDSEYSAVFQGKSILQILNALISGTGMYFWAIFEDIDYYSIIF